MSNECGRSEGEGASVANNKKSDLSHTQRGVRTEEPPFAGIIACMLFASKHICLPSFGCISRSPFLSTHHGRTYTYKRFNKKRRLTFLFTDTARLAAIVVN